MFPWLVCLKESDVEDMADHYFPVERYFGFSGTQIDFVQLGVNDEDTLLLGLRHDAAIAAAGGIKSVHEDDNTTAYQNTSGQDAYACLVIRAVGAGTTDRVFKIYSSPNTDSKTTATEIYDFDILNAMNASGEIFTTPILPIQDQEFIVVENNTVGATNQIDLAGVNSAVVERG